MMNAVIYARVSTNLQEKAHTIDQQIKTLTQYAKDNGVNVVDIIKDEARSGADKKRAFSLVRKVIASDDIDSVLITKYDRLARELYLQGWIKIEFQRRNIQVIAVEQGATNGTDPIVKLTEQIIGAVAEFEKSMTRERLDGGLTDKFETHNRRPAGTVPIGYTWSGERHNRQIIVIEKEREIVKAIYEGYLEYKSIRALIRALNKKGIFNKKGKPYSPQGILCILRNRFYLGYVSYHGEEKRGSHKATISAQLFNKVQEKLNR